MQATSILLAKTCHFTTCARPVYLFLVAPFKEVKQMADHESELELELEQEFHEGEMEDEAEGEGWLGTLGNIAGSLLGEEEGEDELEAELEDELEDEDEGEFGAIGNVLGGLLGEQESEDEMETEQFFGGIGKFLKKAAPVLKTIAKTAAPIVGTAIGGPFGGMLGKAAGSLLGEGELEDEYESEMEDELETESEQEMTHEIASHELTHNEAVAEMLAESASQEQHEGEAEAMAGASTVTMISAADRRALRRILPYLVRGVAILTRILRRRRHTRPLVRAVPTIVRRTVRDLKRKAAKGVPITRKTAARAAAKQVRKVLGSPRACSAAIKRNLKVSRAYKRPRRIRARARRRRTMRG
jgi:hypothetical protein